MTTANNKKSIKTAVVVTYVIATLLLVAGWFVPAFGYGQDMELGDTMLFWYVPAIINAFLNPYLGKDLITVSEHKLPEFAGFEREIIPGVDIQIPALMILVYLVITVLALVLLIPVCAAKKDKTSVKCAYSIEGSSLIEVSCSEEDAEAIVAFIGKQVEVDWDHQDLPVVSRRVLITKSNINGKKLGDMHFRSSYGVTVTRITRSGMELFASPNLTLQVGDRLMVVGREDAVNSVALVLGNQMKSLNTPNIVTIFVGLFLGILVGSLPISFPGMPTPVKLGLAGGPLVVAILIGRFGYKMKLVTYTTTSANLMLREIGLVLFLASVGIDAGAQFVQTVLQGDGLLYVLWGFLITIIPLLAVGIFARAYFKVNYFILMGVIGGATTDPPALAYSNQVAGNPAPSVGYSTVYPLTMFLRILAGQMILLTMM